jgi:hypothetical protein
MASRGTRGRPRKYGRPSRAVTVTLPDDILARLSAVHADPGSAIVNLVERRTSARQTPMRPAHLTRYGRNAVIVVTPGRILKRLEGVQLVPVGDGRALISLAPTMSISALELQVRDQLERLGADDRERGALESLAGILRQGRGAGALASETRTIIVLASKPRRRAT